MSIKLYTWEITYKQSELYFILNFHIKNKKTIIIIIIYFAAPSQRLQCYNDVVVVDDEDDDDELNSNRLEPGKFYVFNC